MWRHSWSALQPGLLLSVQRMWPTITNSNTCIQVRLFPNDVWGTFGEPRHTFLFTSQNCASIGQTRGLLAAKNCDAAMAYVCEVPWKDVFRLQETTFLQENYSRDTELPFPASDWKLRGDVALFLLYTWSVAESCLTTILGEAMKKRKKIFSSRTEQNVVFCCSFKLKQKCRFIVSTYYLDGRIFRCDPLLMAADVHHQWLTFHLSGD